jgi:hypothetical protein
VLVAIFGCLSLVRWAEDAGKKRAEDAQYAKITADAQYSNITPVPVKVSNPYVYLQTGPDISSKRAECVGICSGNIGAADSITQQGAALGWVRLIARYPQGYIKGWLPANEIQTNPRQLGWPRPRSQPPPQVVSRPPDTHGETEQAPVPQQDVPDTLGAPTSDIAPDRPPTATWPPEGILVPATHIGHNGCDGQLTLKVDLLEFVCPADQTKLTVPIGDVKGIDNNGFVTREGDKYHFTIPHYSNDRTAALFAQWWQASKSDQN